eukprot:19604-Heterococcus_DN1.PRE.2
MQVSATTTALYSQDCSTVQQLLIAPAARSSTSASLAVSCLSLRRAAVGVAHGEQWSMSALGDNQTSRNIYDTVAAINTINTASQYDVESALVAVYVQLNAGFAYK